MKHAFAAAIAAVLLAGCSPTASAPSTSASVSASPTPSGASVTQWASAIAPLKADWTKMQSQWGDATCSSLAVDGGAVDCGAYIVAMGFTAKTIHLKAQAMTDSTVATGYLGTPPSEIASAYADLTEAAEKASTAGDAVDCPGKKCLKAAFDFEMAWKSLGDALEEWEPWL